MRWDDLYIKASAMALGRREDTAAAVADGRYDPQFRTAHGYLSVSVADGDGLAADLAVDAGRAALSRAGGAAVADVRLVLHSRSRRQDPEDLVAASYIQGQVVGGSVPAVEIDQECNGALAALELASAYLAAAPAASAVLLTTSDRLPPAVNRYGLSRGGLPGDAGTALLLGRGGGVARLLATVVRGNGSFAAPSEPAPARATTREEALAEQRRRLQPMLRCMAELQRESVAVALADTALRSEEISWWVFPNGARYLVDERFYREFGIDEAKTTWDWGRTVGHLGAGNQIAGFTHLIESGAAHPGDRIALCGSGIGFSYGCAVLEMTAQARWPAT